MQSLGFFGGIASGLRTIAGGEIENLTQLISHVFISQHPIDQDIILTIGMAVDSNVLIFERIREELRSGKTVPSAVEQGFGHAFVTIIDTHVTTIVSSMFLYVFGAGPIRGFAVTLVLGLLVNLFSAVYVSRTIFMWLLTHKGKRVESLSI